MRSCYVTLNAHARKKFFVLHVVPVVSVVLTDTRDTFRVIMFFPLFPFFFVKVTEVAFITTILFHFSMKFLF